MRALIGIVFLFCCGWIFGQARVGNLFEELPSDSIYPSTLQSHSGVLPMIRLDRNQVKSEDSSQSYFKVNGLADLGYRYTDRSEYRGGLGLSLESELGKKWYFRLSGITGVAAADSIFIPKSYVLDKFGDAFLYTDLRGRVSYTPNEIFNFQVGLDHNFIGEGSRSLFLSDYGKPYPFAQIRTRFWRVEYTVMYQFFKERKASDWFMKNGATHHISFNAAKWLNFGIFETVIFQPKDTLLNRGYEVEYLNPVIFYRPQEYSLGSSDNVLLGFSMTAKYHKHALYAQFILDEFFLKEVRAKSGWWANKYGGQLGIKGRFNLGKMQCFYRTEYNFARPYTYAHLNSGQNYGNQGMTLAHPYGGNFMELLGEFKVQKQKWLLNTFFSYSLRGLDKDGFSYGANVYEPYTMRPFDYDHFIGGGKGNNAFRAILTVAYRIMNHGNLQVFCENQLRYDSAFKRTSYVPMVGIRSQLWNDYRNY